MSATRFLDSLENAQHTAGVYLLPGFVSSVEAGELFESLNDDSIFPWDLKPVLYGERLTQHAYLFKRKQKDIEKWPGLAKLEQLCQRIEEHLDGEVPDVFCNRFQDVSHQLPWHTDTYGHHIVVLSLGSRRNIEFREFKTKKVEVVSPAAGDMYFMPLKLNETHEHRVCKAQTAADGTRLSFVFFFKPPAYAKDFKISTRQKIRGIFEGFLEAVM